MKQYFITSLYTQGTQISIQEDHAGKELFKNVIKNEESDQFDIFWEYINKHKTTISLGVGQPTELLKLYSYIMTHKDKLNIPVGIFQEPSLNYTPTCLSFVATEKLGLNINHSLNNFLKMSKIGSFHDLRYTAQDGSYPVWKCPFSTFELQVSELNGDFNIEVSFEESDFEYIESDNVHLDLENEDVIKELYIKHNQKDAKHFGLKVDNKEKKSIKPIRKVYNFSVVEINFLLMIKSLRLK